MIVDGVLTLYTSLPASAQMQTLVKQMQALGLEVFLMPLSQMETKKKTVITPTLHKSLQTMAPN